MVPSFLPSFLPLMCLIQPPFLSTLLFLPASPFFPLHSFFPPSSLFLLALSFSIAFISTSYRITVQLGEYNEAVPLQLQTFTSPVCQGTKTNPEQIFWHSDTREDVFNDSKDSDSSSTKSKSIRGRNGLKNNKWERGQSNADVTFFFSFLNILYLFDHDISCEISEHDTDVYWEGQ